VIRGFLEAFLASAELCFQSVSRAVYSSLNFDVKIVCCWLKETVVSNNNGLC
jgi:hypothetical protein